MKRVRNLVIICLMLITSMATSSVVHAELIGKYVYYQKTLHISVEKDAAYFLEVYETYPGYLITSMSSSNPDVIAIPAADDQYAINKNTFYSKSPGSSILTITMQQENGKKKKVIKSNITVYPHEDPIKSVKINGKKVKLRINPTFEYEAMTTVKTKTAKVVYNLNSGWCIEKAYYDKLVKRNGEYINTMPKVNLNKIPPKADLLHIIFKNKTTGVMERGYIFLTFKKK